MSRIVYNTELLGIMALFEKETRTKLKDCFFDANNLLTFVVQETEIGKAIGKGASNVKRLESLLNRKIKIVEFNPSLVQFIKNLVFPMKDFEVELDGTRAMLRSDDVKTKSILIGRNGQNLKNTQSIVQKYFDITEIRVV